MGKHVSFGSSSSGIKEHVKGLVTFEYYRDGNLFYKTESGLRFPVPVSDIGNATFMASDRAMLFMRWIRQHLEINKGVAVMVDVSIKPNEAKLVDPSNPANSVLIKNIGDGNG